MLPREQRNKAVHQKGYARAGFTLLEILLAVSILAVASTVTYMAFSTVTTAWKKGTLLADGLHHGDFVMDQLAMALRSAYYPDTGGQAPGYGFEMEDRDGGGHPNDVITWTKTGATLVGKGCRLSGSPHRVRFTVEEDDEKAPEAMVRYWEMYSAKAGPDGEDFDPDKLEPVFLSRKVIGFNCRAAYRKVADEIEWLDEWKETNRLPTAVELTLYLEPLRAGEDPVEIKRAVGIPVAPLSWR